MNINTQQNNFVSYVIMLIAFFVLIFFTKDIILDIYSNTVKKSELESDYIESTSERKRFSDLKSQLESGSGSSNSDLTKYATVFSQDEFIEFIYSYLENSNTGTSRGIIKNINFAEPIINELGFTQVDIDLAVKISDVPTLLGMLDFLVSGESKYKIFITSFSYPNNDTNESFSVNIPLSIFYK